MNTVKLNVKTGHTIFWWMFSVIQVEEPGARAETSSKSNGSNFLKARGHMVAKCNFISSGLRALSSSTQQLYLISSVSVAFLKKKMWENANILINLRGETNKKISLVTVLFSPILTRVIINHYILPMLRPKVKRKHHLHSAWSQYWLFSQKPASLIVQGHNLWRGGSVFSDTFYHCQKQVSWIIPHLPGWPGRTEFCRRCRLSHLWNQRKWLWCSLLHYSFSRSWQSWCWALEHWGSSRRRLLDPRRGAEAR